MNKTRKIVIAFIEAGIIVLLVFSLANILPLLLGKKTSSYSQQFTGVSDANEQPYPPPVTETQNATSTKVPYPPPVSDTSISETQTPVISSTIDVTPTTAITEGPTITPIPLPTIATDAEGEILFLEYGTKKAIDLKKVKVDKLGKVETGSIKASEDTIPYFTIDNIYPSPDKKSLAIMFETDIASGMILNLSSGKFDKQPMVPFSYEAFLGWHPDSKHILVSNSVGLWLVDTKGGGKKDITLAFLSNGGKILAAASSPDGQQVVYSINLSSGGSEIWIVDSDGENAKKVSDQVGAVSLAWSPDGSRIAFWSGSYYLMNADGTNLHILCTMMERGGSNIGMPPLWSPDSRYLLTDVSGIALGGSTDYERSNIYLIDADNGDTRSILTDGSTGHLFPIWSPDGKMISFLSQQNGKTDVWVVNIDGSNLRQLTTDGGGILKIV